MAEINRSELTVEQLSKALECKTAEELMALAKSEGYEITNDEAEAYLAELANFELDSKELDKVAGGDMCWTQKCNGFCPYFLI